MAKAVAFGVLICMFLLTCSALAMDNGENEFAKCNCDEESWSIGKILEFERVGDFLIAVAYFSIPVELLYFVTCSSFPFKWVLFQFIAFIVLCGMTHLLNGWTYGPHSFQLMVALTVFKILTALVSCATTITLLTLIPLLLKVKVRELMLKKKTWDLGREVGMIMRQKEASIHVRMLTQEIRKSLDRHKILYTTLVELSTALGLQNCAVWMEDVERKELSLTHELNGRNVNRCIPVHDPDVVRIKESDEVNVLECGSALAIASSGGSGMVGPVAAIRMPMLRGCNFNGGAPRLGQTCYAVLVLVLPSGEVRPWSDQELEIIKVVADQVAVALSHAAILEESQLMKEKLEEQNQALQQERMNAMMANKARDAFQRVMSRGMGRPMHCILGLLSMMQQEESLKNERKLVLDSMLRIGNVLSNLVNDAMDGGFPLEIRPFGLHAMVKEAAAVVKFLCVYRRIRFVLDVDKSLPNLVVGDEKRVFQVILHMAGNVIDGNQGAKALVFRVYAENGNQGRHDVNVRFEIGINAGNSESESSVPLAQFEARKHASDRVEGRLSFGICKRIIQMMQGDLWLVPNAQGFPQVMTLFLRFKLRRFAAISMPEHGENFEQSNLNSFLRGLHVLLAENDDVNRAVTRKLLQKLGCVVTCVSSGFECLSVIAPAGSSFQVILVDLHMAGLDGFEVAARIRKFRSRTWPVIVAMTESTEDHLLEKCMQIGIDGVVRKPVMMQGIAAELRRILVQGNNVRRG